MSDNYSYNVVDNKKDLTIIGSSTVIESNGENAISCGGDIEVRGKIRGSLSVSGYADVYGSVEGNVVDSQLNAQNGAVIKGDINCQNSIRVFEGSLVEGNINSKSANINSTVVGNVVASSDVKLTSSASVNGSITTSSFNVDSGASIIGQLQVVKK